LLLGNFCDHITFFMYLIMHAKDSSVLQDTASSE
jgi:hypothetical protein